MVAFLLRAIGCLLFCTVLSRLAAAEPADYVHTPRVEAGEIGIGFKSGTSKQGGVGRAAAAALGIGRGINHWWSTEVYVLYHRNEMGETALEALEWENTFSLVGADDPDLGTAIGLIIELQHARDRADGDELIFGPLLESHWGRLRLNLNLLFSGTYRGEVSKPLQLGYQFQARYPLLPFADLGMQAFGNLGKWNAWARKADQSHRLGPALFGSFTIGEQYRIHYDVALLFEATNRRKGQTLRAALSYDF